MFADFLADLPYTMNIILCEWIEVIDFVVLNTAICNTTCRSILLHHMSVKQSETLLVGGLKCLKVNLQSGLITLNKTYTCFVIGDSSTFFYTEPDRVWHILMDQQDLHLLPDFSAIQAGLTVQSLKHPITFNESVYGTALFSFWVDPTQINHSTTAHKSVCKESQYFDVDQSTTDRYTYGNVTGSNYSPDMLHCTASLYKTDVNGICNYFFTGDVQYDDNHNGVAFTDCDENHKIFVAAANMALHSTQLWPGTLQHGDGFARSIESGNSFEGEWESGLRNGNGTLTYGNGDVYVGGWSMHHKHGNGTMTYVNGCMYDGGWRGNATYGEASLYYGSGAVLTGEWGPGMMRGTGTLALPNGDEYSGLFHKDSLYGHGAVKYKNNTQFVGEFDHFTYRDEVGSDVFPVRCQNNRCYCQVQDGHWFDMITSMIGRLNSAGNKHAKHSKWERPQSNQQGIGEDISARK